MRRETQPPTPSEHSPGLSPIFLSYPDHTCPSPPPKIHLTHSLSSCPATNLSTSLVLPSILQYDRCNFSLAYLRSTKALITPSLIHYPICVAIPRSAEYPFDST
ncbi:hypothetical protein BT63DRAFT_99295 [Microthyrium microscopicum]|uniref:Uncharacterized protein n=1 Tax=Microthyrium microscopicum TaxID=703497 RepID=A0A6A6TX50_9PEZI|nr:hypothetical protein BT63DRAFT_99295 [Microthyrium microscopicum]